LWPIQPPVTGSALQRRARAQSHAVPSGCVPFIGLGLFGLLAWAVFAMILSNTKPARPRYDNASDIRPLAPNVQWATPPPEPPVAPAMGFAPIASHVEGGADIALPSWQEIESTRLDAQRVAQGSSDENRVRVDSAMDRLRRNLRAPLPPDQAERRDEQQRFEAFLAVVPAYAPEAVELRLRELSDALARDPYDAEYACEWSWLALLSGRRDEAFDGFLRTVWADPQYSCGWLGFGALTQDTRSSYGALVMAERLQLLDGADLALRDALVEAALGEAGAARWRILDARARVRNAQSRRITLPPEISARARESVPVEAR
jgi:hypothetical protein